MNQEQFNSLMVATRMDTTQGHTFSVARTIGVTTWQSVSAICHCRLTWRFLCWSYWTNLF